MEAVRLVASETEFCISNAVGSNLSPGLVANIKFSILAVSLLYPLLSSRHLSGRSPLLRSSLDFYDPPKVGCAADSGETSGEFREGAEVCLSYEITVLSANSILPVVAPSRLWRGRP